MSWWPFLRLMDSGNDRVEWFLRPLVPLLDKEVAWGSNGHPSATPLFRGRSIWRRPWEYDEPFFFWQLWRLGFPPPQLLPNGNVACVVATCHAGIGWGVFGSTETFQFSHVFLGASFLKPLCSFSMLIYFLFFQNFAFLYALLLWFLCSSPWFLSFTFFFRYTPLFFLFFLFFWSFICFIFLCFVAFLNFAFFCFLFDGLFWY